MCLIIYTDSLPLFLTFTMSASRIEYSEKYADDGNEYRCVNQCCHGFVFGLTWQWYNSTALFGWKLRTAAAYISTHDNGCTKHPASLIIISLILLSLILTFSSDFQTCDPSQGFGKEFAQESSVDGSRVARYWRPAVSRMATLCNSSVRVNCVTSCLEHSST